MLAKEAALMEHFAAFLLINSCTHTSAQCLATARFTAELLRASASGFQKLTKPKLLTSTGKKSNPRLKFSPLGGEEGHEKQAMVKTFVLKY